MRNGFFISVLKSSTCFIWSFNYIWCYCYENWWVCQFGVTVSWNSDYRSFVVSITKMSLRNWTLNLFCKVFSKNPFLQTDHQTLDGIMLFMPGLVLLNVTSMCWLRYKNRHVGVLVLHLMLFLKTWLIIEMLIWCLEDFHQNQLNWLFFLILVGNLLAIQITHDSCQQS